jgi:hypothetical protein
LLQVFNKTNEKAGLVGLYATPEKLTLAHIIRNEARPELMVCEEVVVAGAEARADALEKLVSEHDLEGLRASFVLSLLITNCYWSKHLKSNRQKWPGR